MRQLPYTTKLIIDAYSNSSFLKRLLSNIYFYITKYKIIYKSPQNRKVSKVLFLISWEKSLRKDHQEQFRYLFKSCQEGKKGSVNYFEVKRVIDLNIISIIKNFTKYPCLSKLTKFQMDEVVGAVHNYRISKVLVFCDTSPLQNYISAFYNKKQVKTYSLQHGFYIEDKNRLFRVVYKCSNAKYFFVWDDRTLSFMKKYQGKKERIFIQSGPFYQSDYGAQKVMNDKEKEVLSIGIYGCGKDQVEQNLFLVDLFRLIKERKKYEVTFISHPFFKIVDRIKLYVESGVFPASNNLKKKNYDLSLVLNSSVWIELEEKGRNYYMLNSDFERKAGFEVVLNNILDKRFINNSPIRPFKSKTRALEVIKNNLCK